MTSKKNIFIDTGAWLALADQSDQYHSKATAQIKRLLDDKHEFITTNLVIHETFMLISRRLSRKAAITFLDEIISTVHVRIFHSDHAIEKKAFDTIRNYADQDFSVTDCVSFAVMKREGIKRAFTFDKHFKTMRFSVEP